MAAPNLEDLKFYIITPQAATNYVLNPMPYKATTGYTAVGGSIAVGDTYSRRGAGCLEVTPTVNASGVYYSAISITDTYTYTFSVDVKGTAGKAMRIKIEDAGATYSYTTTFTATGYWQRVEVSFTAQETETDYRLYVLRDATTGTTAFYVDGFQFERGTAATTFFSGDTKGFDAVPLEFYWDGVPGASVSYRTAQTRAGGALLDISDYATHAGVFGLGMGNYEQIYTELISGGAMYDRFIRKPRMFSLLLDYTGTMSEITAKRDTILDAVRPDNTGYDQPLVIRYQGLDASGDEATHPVDIVCVPQSSHVDPATECAYNQDTLTFTVLDGHLDGAYKEGVELEYYEELTNSDNVIYQNANGVWQEVDNSGTGIDIGVFVVAEAPSGEIILGGGFTNAGGVAEADYLCKWTGVAIDDVTGAADFTSSVRALCYDAEGNLYIGGEFYDAGDGNGDCIVKWDGTNLSSLGTGADFDVYALAIDPATGYLYAGGLFTSMGGVANTAHIAYWNGTAWNAMATGLSNSVWALVFGPDGNLYIGGAFTNADGANGDYICYWDGTAFNRIGTVELSALVYTLTFDDNGYLYAGGNFTNAGDDANADYIAVNASPAVPTNAWNALGTGVNGLVRHIHADGNKIYVSGAFTQAGDLTLTDRIGYWSNGAWHTLDIDLVGSDNIFYITRTSKDELWIGGIFSHPAIGAKTVNRVPSSGSANCYPVITIRGPGVLQSIRNVSTKRKIIFKNLTLRAGETIRMECNPYKVNFTSSWKGRGNLYRYINPGSDISNFYMKPDQNFIALLIPSGYTANTKAWIEWTPRFWSIEGAKYE